MRGPKKIAPKLMPLHLRDVAHQEERPVNFTCRGEFAFAKRLVNTSLFQIGTRHTLMLRQGIDRWMKKGKRKAKWAFRKRSRLKQ